MMELLGALAIMVVMFLLAVPAFMQIQTNYQMMKLDATAKTIYTAAQDRLVSLQSSGRLQTVAGNVAATNQTAAVPADYPSDNGDDIERYYLK
jgi:Tfp pilus assembly protein FimT